MFSSSQNIEIYNRHNISQAAIDIETNKHTLNIVIKDIEVYSKAVTHSKIEYQAENKKLSKIKDERIQRENDLKAISNQPYSGIQSSQSHPITSSQSQPYLPYNINDPRLQELIKEEKKQQKIVIEKKQVQLSFQGEYNSLISRKHDLENINLDLETFIFDAKKFLERLNYTPEWLCNNLINQFVKAVRNFKEEYLSIQNKDVRAELYKFEEKIECFQPQPGNSPEQNRVLYLQLIGYLWTMYQRIESDTTFAQVIFGLLQSGHIDEFGDLPDEFCTSMNCQDHFKKFESGFIANYFHTTFEELDQANMQQYKSAHTQIVQDIRSNELLSDVATAVVARIDKQMQNAEIEVNPHVEFYTDVLESMHARMTNKNCAKKKDEHFKRLISQAKGSPSIGKHIAGGLLMFVGVSLIAAAVVGVIFTAGGSAPISALAAKVGVSIAAMGVGLALGISASATAGLYSGISGFKLFCKGNRRNLSKDLYQFDKDIRTASREGGLKPSFAPA